VTISICGLSSFTPLVLLWVSPLIRALFLDIIIVGLLLTTVTRIECRFFKYNKQTRQTKLESLQASLEQQSVYSIYGRIYTKDALSVLVDELGQTFVVRLIMRLWYKDRHKTYYASRRTISRSESFKTN